MKDIPQSPPRIGQSRKICPTNADRSTAGPIHRAQQIQQRALARPAPAQQRDPSPPRNIQRNLIERSECPVPFAIRFAHAIDNRNGRVNARFTWRST